MRHVHCGWGVDRLPWLCAVWSSRLNMAGQAAQRRYPLRKLLRRVPRLALWVACRAALFSASADLARSCREIEARRSHRSLCMGPRPVARAVRGGHVAMSIPRPIFALMLRDFVRASER